MEQNKWIKIIQRWWSRPDSFGASEHWVHDQDRIRNKWAHWCAAWQQTAKDQSPKWEGWQEKLPALEIVFRLCTAVLVPQWSAVFPLICPLWFHKLLFFPTHCPTLTYSSVCCCFRCHHADIDRAISKSLAMVHRLENVLVFQLGHYVPCTKTNVMACRMHTRLPHLFFYFFHLLINIFFLRWLVGVRRLACCRISHLA